MIANSSFDPHHKKQKQEFSEREIEIIKFICEEKSNKEIALLMNLSTRTIEGNRERILEKIDAKNSVGLVVYAIKNKIFEVRN